MTARRVSLLTGYLLALVLAWLALGQTAHAQGFPKPGEAFGEADAGAAAAEGEGAVEKPQPDAVEQAELALRQQIAKKLGGEDGNQFILVFSKALAATIPNRTPLPPGAKRLPNGRWLEVIYQVEMTDGKPAAVDLVVEFARHAHQHPDANYDWGLVARQDDPAKAQQALQLAQTKYARAAVTYRPRTPEGLQFFSRDQPKFLGRDLLKPPAQGGGVR